MMEEYGDPYVEWNEVNDHQEHADEDDVTTAPLCQEARDRSGNERCFDPRCQRCWEGVQSGLPHG